MPCVAGILIRSVGAAFLAVYYTKLTNLFASAEDLWEAVFSLIAALMIFVVCVNLSRSVLTRTAASRCCRWIARKRNGASSSARRSRSAWAGRSWRTVISRPAGGRSVRRLADVLLRSRRPVPTAIA